VNRVFLSRDELNRKREWEIIIQSFEIERVTAGDWKRRARRGSLKRGSRRRRVRCSLRKLFLKKNGINGGGEGSTGKTFLLGGSRLQKKNLGKERTQCE